MRGAELWRARATHPRFCGNAGGKVVAPTTTTTDVVKTTLSRTPRGTPSLAPSSASMASRTTRVGVALVAAAAAYLAITSAAAPHPAVGGALVHGDASVMATKGKHGGRSTVHPMQDTLRWGADRNVADRICTRNRRYAEHSGYWRRTDFLEERRGKQTVFRDAVTGLPIFVAPKVRDAGASAFTHANERISHLNRATPSRQYPNPKRTRALASHRAARGTPSRRSPPRTAGRVSETRRWCGRT